MACLLLLDWQQLLDWVYWHFQRLGLFSFCVSCLLILIYHNDEKFNIGAFGWPFQVETLLQLLGSAAIVQFVSKKFLFAEVCLQYFSEL